MLEEFEGFSGVVRFNIRRRAKLHNDTLYNTTKIIFLNTLF